RNLGLVKSTLAVSWTAALSCLIVQEAASAQPWAREARGSRAEVGESRRLAPPPPPLSPRSQYCLAGPISRSHGSLLGVGVGVGAAVADPASANAAACSAATAPVTVRTRRGLPGISEPSVLLNGLADFVRAGSHVVSGHRRRAVLLRVRRNLPVAVGPLKVECPGLPRGAHRVGRLLACHTDQAHVPVRDLGAALAVLLDL